MESLPRNGSYVQRRKMYANLPLHNLNSKVPIDWNSELPHTYERHRSIQKEINEKQYIKRTYDQKMERRLREKYNGEHRGKGRESGIDDSRDVLARQVEEFNTSKIIPSKTNNPEYSEQTPEPSTPSSKQEERYRKGPEGSRNEREGAQNQRERRYSERQRSYDSERDRNRQRETDYRESKAYFERDRQGYAANDRPPLERSYHELQHSQRDPYTNPSPSMLYRGQSDLAANPYRPPYYLSSPQYKPPYEDQNQYSYSRQYRPQYHPELPPGHYNPHPFRNHMPDRLEEFLRENTKADRKSGIVVNLKDK